MVGVTFRKKTSNPPEKKKKTTSCRLGSEEVAAEVTSLCPRKQVRFPQEPE